MGITVIKHEIVDMSNFGITTNCQVHTLHVQVTDVKAIAKSLIHTTSDVSWITPLELGFRSSYLARAEPTIEKLVDGIFKKITNKVNSEFGEYLISFSAQQTLKNQLSHSLIPLAELWKEKSTGNPGFDFHTESSNYHIAFGEAKYNANSNPHTDAILQIEDFIKKNKDDMDLVHLKNFVSKDAYNNASAKKKAYAAAFSMISTSNNFDKIIQHPFTLPEIQEILKHQELFLIGVEIC